MVRKALATIPTSKLEYFLTELANLRLANLQDDDRAVKRPIERFLNRFGEMLADLPSAKQWSDRGEERTRWALEALKERHALGRIVRNRNEDGPSKENDEPSDWVFGTREDMAEFSRLFDVRSAVQLIWRATTTEEKQLRALLLHNAVMTSGTPAFLLPKEVSLPGPFSQAVVHLLKSAHRALVCSNPECPAPFFFRRKRRQRYCSESCSGVGQREAKRRWWTAHGGDWREKHTQKRVVSKDKKKNEKRRNADGARKTR